jgi:putative hydrolase of the HAD superfamily
MIKALFFDLDDTVYDYRGPMRDCEEYLSDTVAQSVGVESDKCLRTYLRLKRELYKESPHDPVIFDFRFRISRLFSKLGDMVDERRIDAIFTDFWQRFLMMIEPYPDLIPLLDVAGEEGLKTAIVTNGTVEQQTSKIDRLALSDTMDLALTSEEVGANKPQPSIFLRALDRLGVCAEEAIMIGDICQVDIKGANEVGMPTCWIRRGIHSGSPPRDRSETPDFSVRTLRDIPGLLEAF